MPKKLMKRGKYKNKERFVIETNYERKTLEDARKYWGDASTLLIEGLGRKNTKKGAASRFANIKRGEYSGGLTATIPVEDWEKIESFASRYRNGERGDPIIVALKI